jgi:hypothetical protein
MNFFLALQISGYKDNCSKMFFANALNYLKSDVGMHHKFSLFSGFSNGYCVCVCVCVCVREREI